MKKLLFLVFTLSLVGCNEKFVTPNVQVQQIDNAPGVTNSAKELTRVTDQALGEFYPAISPDGTRILYHGRDDTKTGNERWTVYMKEVGRPGVTPLTAGFSTNPTWSSDGQEFYYTYLKPAKSIIVKSRVGGMGISYVSANAMGEEDNNPTLHLNPKFDKVLFNTKIGSSYQVATMDKNGMNFTLLLEGNRPKYHPTRNQILFQKAVGAHTHLFLYDNESGQIMQLTSGDNTNMEASFSPNGQYITYVSNMDGQQHVYMMRSDGTNPVQLTTGTLMNGGPVWSKDGYIYFHSNAGNQRGNTWDYADIWRLRPVY